MKSNVRPMVQIVLDVLFIPMHFINFFHDMAIFPDGENLNYYSPVDNLTDMGAD